MKKVLFFALSLSFTVMVMAQNSGLGFNYQAVVRNADGILLANSSVSLRVSLYPGQMSANPTWVETHIVTTDISGCFCITVGHGTRDNASIAANYSDINFAAVYYWMKIEINENGTYREVSFAQLPSSPYSEVAHNAIAIPAGSIIPFAGPAENIPAGRVPATGREPIDFSLQPEARMILSKEIFSNRPLPEQTAVLSSDIESTSVPGRNATPLRSSLSASSAAYSGPVSSDP